MTVDRMGASLDPAKPMGSPCGSQRGDAGTHLEELGGLVQTASEVGERRI